MINHHRNAVYLYTTRWNESKSTARYSFLSHPLPFCFFYLPNRPTYADNIISLLFRFNFFCSFTLKIKSFEEGEKQKGKCNCFLYVCVYEWCTSSPSKQMKNTRTVSYIFGYFISENSRGKFVYMVVVFRRHLYLCDMKGETSHQDENQ